MSDSKKSRGDSSQIETETTSSETTTAERVQKIIAQAGIASRRDAEDMIREGQVTINGKTAGLGDKATIGVDAIKVRGKLIHFTQDKVYYMIYKPKNVIAMINEDEEGRATLKDLIRREIKERVFTVGRMDFKGEGAIILTNDGEMAQKILKSNDIIRRYHVKVDRHPSQEDLARLARGGRIEGRSMQPYHIRVVENYARNALIEISFEGMGSVDVKKFFENKGFFPEKVARVGIGHISAEKMTPGSFKKLQASSVEALFAQPELAKKHIERLTEKKTGGVRVVDEDDLHRDADRKRRGKGGDFVSNTEKRNFSPKGFVRTGGSAAGRSSEGRSSRPAGRPVGGRPTGSAGRSAPRRDENESGRSSERSFGERSFGSKRGEGRPMERSGRSFEREERTDRGFKGDRPTRSFADRTGGRKEFGSSDRGPGERPTGGRSFRPAGRPSAGRSAEGRSPRPAGRTSGSATGRTGGSAAGRSSTTPRSGGASKIRFKRTVR